MKMNLSLILDEEGQVRCDLLTNQSLEEIDQYTTFRESHNDIREEYQELIEAFLKQQEDYTKNFPREANKKGRIVILYQDTDNKAKLRKLRVLYSQDKNKLDPLATLKVLIRVLKREKHPELAMRTITNQSFILASDFAKKEMAIAAKKMHQSPDIAERANNDLINKVIKNKLTATLESNPERGYFYIRKIDAYIETKEGIPTTTKVKKTTSSAKKRPASIKVQKDNPYAGKIVTDQKLPQKGFISMSEIDLWLKENHDREMEVETEEKDDKINQTTANTKTRKSNRFASQMEIVSNSSLIDTIIQEHLKRGERASYSDIYLEYLERMEPEEENRVKR